MAGFTAPEGKTMGHAGAIVSRSSGTAGAKKAALEAAGVKVGKTPSEAADFGKRNCSQTKDVDGVDPLVNSATRAGISTTPAPTADSCPDASAISKLFERGVDKDWAFHRVRPSNSEKICE
jgi:hypothetical protein